MKVNLARVRSRASGYGRFPPPVPPYVACDLRDHHFSSAETRMKFIMGGHLFEISTLDPTINEAFLDLHAAFFGDRPYDWDEFCQLSHDFFDHAKGDSGAQNKYFENFTIIWRNHLNGGRLEEAEHIWQMATQPALQWELRNPGHFIHKGTPFYFWGMTAIFKGDLDRGYLLMHQALAEDIRTTNSDMPDTPSLAFVTLNYTKVDQAFREFLMQQAHFLDSLLSTYRLAHSKSLTLDAFTRRFLTSPPSAETLFLLAFALARLLRLSDFPDFSLASDFAGQFELNLLFDVVLVLEAALAHKNPSSHKFIDHAAFLSDLAKLPLSKANLQEVNKMFDRDFDATLQATLNGSLNLPDRGTPSPIERSISLSYGLRNLAAHNVSSPPGVWKHFLEVRQCVFDSLFLSVETLY